MNKFNFIVFHSKLIYNLSNNLKIYNLYLVLYKYHLKIDYYILL